MAFSVKLHVGVYYQEHAMSKTLQFESSISELETIVSQLEKGDLPLEKSLQQFEKGIHIAQQCQQILSQAEQKIEMLSVNKTPPQEMEHE
jgi:exodeoxyribonuclease VII small subunit